MTRWKPHLSLSLFWTRSRVSRITSVGKRSSTKGRAISILISCSMMIESSPMRGLKSPTQACLRENLYCGLLQSRPAISGCSLYINTSQANSGKGAESSIPMEADAGLPQRSTAVDISNIYPDPIESFVAAHPCAAVDPTNPCYGYHKSNAGLLLG